MNKDRFKFVEMHFHWGENNQIRSEMKINNESFPLEMHMVFYNTKYSNYSTAREMENGLCVLSTLFEVSDRLNNPTFMFTNRFDDILEYGSSIEHNFHFKRFNAFLPIRINSYYTYNGSLTTPPYSESAIWIVFVDRLRISSEQVCN